MGNYNNPIEMFFKDFDKALLEGCDVGEAREIVTDYVYDKIEKVESEYVKEHPVYEDYNRDLDYFRLNQDERIRSMYKKVDECAEEKLNAGMDVISNSAEDMLVSYAVDVFLYYYYRNEK
jgi:hypothetical protein